MSVLTIRRPDDWHLHLRDGAALSSVVKFSAERFGRAIVMPNLKPPVVTTAAATAYQKRVLAALPKASTFTPLMTLYLTESTPVEEIHHAKARDLRIFYSAERCPCARNSRLSIGREGRRRRRRRAHQRAPG